MNGRRTIVETYVAWLLVVLASVGTVFGVVVEASESSTTAEAVSYAVWVTPFVAFSVVGALIVSKRARNGIGWALVAIGFTVSTTTPLGGYATLARRGSSLPGADVAAFLEQVAWLPGAGALLVVVPLIFPTGRLPNARWRPVLGLGIAVVVAHTWARAALTWPVRHRIDPGSADVAESFGAGWLRSAEVGLSLAVMAFALVAVSSLVPRYRAAGHLERAQLRWMALGTFATVVIASASTTLDLPPVTDAIANGIASCAVPVAIGIALTRYRLYDIDRLVHRTVVYATVSVIVATVYASIAVLPMAVFDLGGSDVLVAGATLAAAAVFRPVRSRVQTAVDRRFSRERYDAARTIEAFGQRLRSRVELDGLEEDLRSVVSATVRPSHVSVWSGRVTP